ncbi:MAG: NfeD family protein [Planctomycetota bacterium]
MILLLFVVASALVVAEVLFPSFGLLSLLSISCYVTAVIKAFDIGQTQGYTALSAVIILAPITIWGGFQILRHTSLGRRLILSGPKEADVRGRGTNKNLETYLGREGVAATDLRPSGAVDIGDDRVDAVSEGDFVEAGTKVRVVYVEGNRLVVETLAAASSA